MLPGCWSVPDDSTYIRNVDPPVVGTPASDTTIPVGLYENTTTGVGAGPSAVGLRRIDPLTSTAGPDVASFCELRLGMLYEKLLAVWPPIVTLTPVPLSSLNCTSPVMVVSVGFTRRTCVIQPWPSAKCGMIWTPLNGAAEVSMTGSVETRKSPRSLM